MTLDFEYVQSRTLAEAIEQYGSFARSGLNVLYYGGGTEIITLGRLHQVFADVVIDIKAIPTARTMVIDGERLILGAAVTLTELTDHPAMSNEFPLLQAAVNEIADRTARNKITLGGNICGQIFYREAVLPFLVCDSSVRIAGPTGVREVPIGHVFQRQMLLVPGEFVLQMVTDKFARLAPYIHIKQRKMGHIGYPIVAAVAIRVNDSIRVALSGVLPFPFRSFALEAVLNRKDSDFRHRIHAAIQLLPMDLVLDDYEASREYRLFVLQSILADIVHALGG